MADAEGTVAVSIGSQRISMAVFDPAKGGSLILKSYGSSSILADPAQEMARLPQIGLALRELSANLKCQKERVRYAMSGQSVFTRFVKLPALDSDNIDQLVQFEAQQHVPFPIDEVTWDWQLLDSNGPEKEVVLVAIKGDSLNEINEVVGDAGLGTKDVDVSPMALYNAFRYNYPDQQEPVLLIDIGAKATNLIYIEGTRLFTRSIAVGGATITTAIAKEYNISFAEAESQKVSNGLVSLGGGHLEQLDDATAQLATVIRNAMNRLSAEIMRTNNYYRSQHEGSAPVQVYLAGGGANLPYLPEFLEEKLRLPIEIFNPFKNISVGKGVDVEQLGMEAHMMGELVGLALRGIGKAPVHIDLVPAVVDKERATARRKPFLTAAAVILVTGIAVWAVNKMNLASAAEREAAEAMKDYGSLQPIVGKIKDLQGKQNALAALGGQYADAQLGRITWINTLDTLRQQFQSSDAVWLTDISPIAGHDKGEAKSGDPVVKDNFPTLSYGSSSLTNLRAPAPQEEEETRGSRGRKPVAKPKGPLSINAVRISGFWRDNPKGPRAVNDILDEIRKNPGLFDLTKGKENVPLKDTEVIIELGTAITDPNDLAAPFTVVLPLAQPLPIN